MTDVAKIAAGLTKAQREAIAKAAGRYGKPPLYGVTIKTLARKGLAVVWVERPTHSHDDDYGMAFLTPLGLAVRDYLKENGHAE